MELNYWAVIVGGLVYFAGGALWYSPVLFGNSWMKEAGWTQQKMAAAKANAWKAYLTSLVSQIIISLALARLMGYMQINSISAGLQVAFGSWLAFVVTTIAINGSFEGRSLKRMTIHTGYHLYGFFAAGLILAWWR